MHELFTTGALSEYQTATVVAATAHLTPGERAEVDRLLAELIRARDGHRCREPYCDAPIRHIDHVRRWAELGRTEFGNGRGLCAFHNHVRETPGWKAEATAQRNTTTTPTGHTYTSDTGNLAGIRQGQQDAA